MKEIVRTCVVCRNSKDKRELVRFVKTAEGAIGFDETGKMAGRGAYICKTCLEKASKTHALNRAFKTQVDESIINVAMGKYEGKS